MYYHLVITALKVEIFSVFFYDFKMIIAGLFTPYKGLCFLVKC